MRRIVHDRPGPPDVLRLEHVPDLVPGDGEVRIAVEVAGVHLVDTSIRSGAFSGPGGEPTWPFVPGREVAGTVDAVGRDVDGAWLGTRVVTHLGPASGGYAEQAVAVLDRVHRIPDGLDADAAVAAIGTGRTATAALELAHPTADDLVVVTAATGGLGAILVHAAMRADAAVVALANGPAKAERAREAGMREVVDASASDWRTATLAALGGPPTIAYDGVGLPFAATLHAMLDPDGVLVTYSGLDADALPAGARVAAVLGPAMLDRPGGIRALEVAALAAAVDGSRRPLVGPGFPLDRTADAHRALEARTTVGEVVLRVEGDR